jgi:hypothetical protein
MKGRLKKMKQYFCKHSFIVVAGYFALNTLEYSTLKECDKCGKKTNE